MVSAMSMTRIVPATIVVAAVLLVALSGLALAAPGDPDPTFDGDGSRTIDYGGFDYASGVLVQSDGKLVLPAPGARTSR